MCSRPWWHAWSASKDDILKRFLQSGYSGFYCAVLQEGEVAAGDPIRLLHRDEHKVSVLDIVRLEGDRFHDVDLLRRALTVEALSQSWRDSFMKRLDRFS